MHKHYSGADHLTGRALVGSKRRNENIKEGSVLLLKYQRYKSQLYKFSTQTELITSIVFFGK